MATAWTCQTCLCLPGPGAGADGRFDEGAVGSDGGVDKSDLALIDFLRLVQEAINPVRAGGSHRDRINLIGDARDRPREVLLERQERHQSTKGQGSATNPGHIPGSQPADGDKSSDHRGQDISQIADIPVDRHHHAADLVGVVGAGTEPLVKDGEILDSLLLMAIYLHHTLP